MAKILLVDDDHEFRDYICKLVPPGKHDIDTAADGQEAIGKIMKEKYDLALIDLLLPGQFNGLDVIKEITGHNEKTIIIALTENTGQNFSPKSRFGVEKFMSKTLLKQTFKATLQACLGTPDKPEIEEKVETPQEATEIKAEQPLEQHIIFEEDSTALQFPAENLTFQNKPMIFTGLPDENMAEILNFSYGQEIKVGEKFVLDMEKHLAVVNDGMVRCWYHETLVGRHVAGQVIGETSIIKNGHPTYELVIEAIMDSHLIVISKEKLKTYLNRNKILSLRYAANTIKSLSKKLIDSYEQVDNLSKNSILDDQFKGLHN